jgi:ketosteroid isomerase-like protein
LLERVRRGIMRGVLGEETPGPSAAVLVERIFEAFASRDADALLEIMGPEIEFYGPTATALNEGKCYRGHEGIRRYLRDADLLWEWLELAPSQYREVGNHVVVLGRVRARAQDGLELDTPAAWVWRVQAGKVVWGCAYGDRDAMPRSLQEGGLGAETGSGILSSPGAVPVPPAL